MPVRTLHLLALLLLLHLGASPARAASRFARGFVIYKTALSDQPAHYQGTLYLSEDTSGPIWLQYDIGQTKPFYLARQMYVTDIKFGLLFEADFTTPQHVQRCREIQAQLAAAARQSPLLTSAVTAATKAIQTEIDHYEKDKLVRLNGVWTDRRQYDALTEAQQKARQQEEARRIQEEADRRAQEEKDRAAFAAMAQDDTIRQAHYTRAYTSIPVQNLLATLAPLLKTSAAILADQASLPVPSPSAADLADSITLPTLPEAPTIDSRLRIIAPPPATGTPPSSETLADTSTDTAPALLTLHDQSHTHTLIAQACLYLESTGPDQPLLPSSQAEYTALRHILDTYHPDICAALPDVIAATTILHTLKDAVANDKSTPYTRRDIPGYTVLYDVFSPDPHPTRHLRLIIITLTPVKQ
ncbi:hypothetical protein [Prosthecobacter vanneervenii]|uniref:Uncharacterized protein n=1 Tax=Prosthecobacter vanneervenii TaxID=48466 RepID=A0A7W7Y8B1_9BACT|nr:hypothetical protein [Prosthecobacter vanneervenii]MBB5031493.1 hypothetical protein [Prosthecobacter vanneervenii]